MVLLNPIAQLKELALTSLGVARLQNCLKYTCTCKFRAHFHAHHVIPGCNHRKHVPKAPQGPRPPLSKFKIFLFLGWCVTLCSSTQESARYKCNKVLKRGQIAHEDPTIKNPDFPSQEPGTSFMSPKGHILT